MPILCHNSGHGSGSKGRNHRSPAARSPGDYSRAVGRNCGVEGEDRGVGTASERQNAAELLAAAQFAPSPRPTTAAETQVEEETRRAARPRETRETGRAHV